MSINSYTTDFVRYKFFYILIIDKMIIKRQIKTYLYKKFLFLIIIIAKCKLVCFQSNGDTPQNTEK